MKNNKWAIRLACLVLVAGTIAGVAIAVGEQGAEIDPLVTLSYLNEVVTPDILLKVDEKVEARANQLEEKILAGGGATFATVEASAGKTLTLTAGSQVILRFGTASTNGLLDSTDGIATEGVLSANHLYIATGESQLVLVSTDATFLVQGRYTVQ